MAKISTSICLTTLSIGLLIFVGCSKQEKVVSKAGVHKLGLLEHLPQDVVGFSTLNTSSTAYTKWAASSFASALGKIHRSTFDSLPTSAHEAPFKGLEVISQALEEINLTPKGSGGSESIRELVAFLNYSEDKNAGGVHKTEAGYFYQGVAGVDLKIKLKELGAALEKAGLKVERTSLEGLEQLKAQLQSDSTTSEPSPFGDTLFAAANSERMALTSSELLTKRLFGPSPADSLNLTPGFTIAKEHLPEDLTEAVGVTYVNFKKLSQLLTESAPTPERAQIAAGIAAVPFEVLVGYVTFDGSPLLRYALPYQIRTQEQKNLIEAMKKGQASTIFGHAPKSALLAVGVDSAILNEIKIAANSQISGTTDTNPNTNLAILGQLSGAGFGIANPSGASPFPELFFLGQSDRASEVASALREIATQLTTASGVPSTPWQNKSIGAAQVDYMLSPLGIGVFVGAMEKTIFMTTSESMAYSIADISSQKTASLLSESADFVGISSITGYLHFGRLHEMLASLQGTLAMFTGGEAGFDASQFADIKELGALTLNVAADDKAIKLNARLR